MNQALTPEQHAFGLLEKILETQPHLLENISSGPNSSGSPGRDSSAGQIITELHAHLLAYLKQRQPS
jgi:hypothetical protein